MLNLITRITCDKTEDVIPSFQLRAIQLVYDFIELH